MCGGIFSFLKLAGNGSACLRSEADLRKQGKG